MGQPSEALGIPAAFSYLGEWDLKGTGIYLTCDAFS